MKILFPVSVSALLVGCLIGYNFPSKSHTLESPVKSSSLNEIDSEKTQHEGNDLEQLVAELKKENQLLRETLVEPTEELLVSEEKNADSLKKQWIDEILNQTEGPRGRNQRELRWLSKMLDLTPDQLIQLELLSNQRDQQRKLRMMVMLGLVDRDNDEYADIRDFDFDDALFGILSEEQKSTYEKGIDQQREQSANVMVGMMTQRYQLTDSEKYSSEEQTKINEVFRSAIKQGGESIAIPEAIDSLQLNPNEKRMLAVSYESMEPELFEKVYESIVNNRQSDNGFNGGPPRGGFGGGRPPRR